MELMRRGAITCTENNSVREIAQIMVVNRIRYCVVVNERHEVLGIISARSILKAFGRNLDETKAKDILLPHTEIITPGSTLKEAIELMSRKRIEHLVVVLDRGGTKIVLGILHARDIVARMARS